MIKYAMKEELGDFQQKRKRPVWHLVLLFHWWMNFVVEFIATSLVWISSVMPQHELIEGMKPASGRTSENEFAMQAKHVLYTVKKKFMNLQRVIAPFLAYDETQRRKKGFHIRCKSSSPFSVQKSIINGVTIDYSTLIFHSVPFITVEGHIGVRWCIMAAVYNWWTSHSLFIWNGGHRVTTINVKCNCPDEIPCDYKGNVDIRDPPWNE